MGIPSDRDEFEADATGAGGTEEDDDDGLVEKDDGVGVKEDVERDEDATAVRVVEKDDCSEDDDASSPNVRGGSVRLSL